MTQSRASAIVESSPEQEQGSRLPVPLVLDFRAIEMTDDQLVRFCETNSELRIELTAEKELIIMPPASMTSGWQNGEMFGQLYIWSKQDGTGLSFDSSSGCTLPNGAMRAADASWILRERWETVPDDDRLRFSHIAPDFVAELRSPSDTLPMLQAKMAEYMENGVRLGWLIDPFLRQVHVYRPGQAVEILDDPETVSGDPVLPGFTLNLLEIW